MCAVLFTNPLEESQRCSCLICPLSRFAFQPESLAVVTGSRVTYRRVCFFQLTVPFYTFLFADKMQRTEDWHGMLEGAGEWQTAVGLTEKQTSCEERAEGLPVKRLEWHLAQEPRCIGALATQPWQQKLPAFLPVTGWPNCTRESFKHLESLPVDQKIQCQRVNYISWIRPC